MKFTVSERRGYIFFGGIFAILNLIVVIFSNNIGLKLLFGLFFLTIVIWLCISPIRVIYVNKGRIDVKYFAVIRIRKLFSKLEDKRYVCTDIKSVEVIKMLHHSRGHNVSNMIIRLHMKDSQQFDIGQTASGFKSLAKYLIKCNDHEKIRITEKTRSRLEKLIR